MAILTHGSNLTLAPTVGPVVRQLGISLVKVIDQFSAAGFQSVQLDASLSGIRPRELSPVARRDLLGTLTRRGMLLAGVDLFIPRKDFLDGSLVDKAMAAALAGIELAADLGRVPLSLPVPVNKMDSSALSTLVEAADGRGVSLAIHAEDQLKALSEWITRVDLPCLGMALDPAAVLARSKPAEDVVNAHAKKLIVARLSDFTITGGGDDDEDTSDHNQNNSQSNATGLRCIVGQGELNLLAYRIALDLAQSRHGSVVFDLRNMENVMQAAAAGKAAWDDASFDR